MNVTLILKITGLSGLFTRGPSRPEATQLRPLPVPEPLISGTAPPVRYTTAESNSIYCASVRLAKALRKARQVPYESDALAELSMAIHKGAIEFGHTNSLPPDVLFGALDTIEQVASREPVVGAWEGSLQSDVEFVARALPLLLLFAQDTGGGLSQWFRDHGAGAAFTAGTGDDVLSKAQQRLDAATAGEVTTVSTTDTMVKIQHGGADPYEIELARITSPLALSRWAHHLGEKTWITGKTIRSFIALSSAVKGWNLYDTEKGEPAI